MPEQKHKYIIKNKENKKYWDGYDFNVEINNAKIFNHMDLTIYDYEKLIEVMPDGKLVVIK
jgi:hypothetical protein